MKSSRDELADWVRQLRVVFEDNHVIAVVKPSGIAIQGNDARKISLLDVVREWIRIKYQKPGKVFLGLVHRLDRPVGGVVVLGKTSKGASRLSEQFRTRSVKKIYWAVVEGQLPHEQGVLVHYMRPGEREVEISGEPRAGFVRASLKYRLLKRRADSSVIEIELETGRKHQIRAQFSLLGHPICGDGKYGAKMSSREGDHIALIAKRLEFSHPVRSEDRIVVEAPESLLEAP